MATTTIRKSKALTSYVKAAHDAGMPADQVEHFITAGYIALPDLLPFHAAARLADKQDGPDSIAMGGTRGPGKSHAALAQVGLDDCMRYPGSKWLFLRKIMKSAAEALEDLVAKVFAHVEHEYKPSLGRVDFPNGSKILLGGYNNDADIDKYLGIEYDGIVIEEATQLTERKVLTVRGSNRSTMPGYRARVYLTTNPDGIGLQWFKQKYILPWRQNREAASRTRFIEGSYKGNPFLKPEYVHYLEHELTGQLRKAWTEGDWDAFEGMAMPYWNEQTMVIRPFSIPFDWVRWRAVDDGYAAPFCCLWFARDPITRRIYVYREAYKAGLNNDQQADTINDMTLPGEVFVWNFADPALWATTAATVKTPERAYRDKGIVLTKADNERIRGKRRVDNIFGNLGDGLPGMQIFSTCTNTIRTLPTLPYDKVHIEDVDTHSEDHAYDTLRYGLTNLPAPAEQDLRNIQQGYIDRDVLTASYL